MAIALLMILNDGDDIGTETSTSREQICAPMTCCRGLVIEIR